MLSLQALAGNRATHDVLSRARRTTSVGTVVQRRVIPAQQTWLRGLLASRGAALATAVAGDPAARLRAIADMGDRMDTVASVRADIDAFEVAVGGAPGFANPNAARIVSALEDSQSNDDLATRLVTLFNASVDPSSASPASSPSTSTALARRSRRTSPARDRARKAHDAPGGRRDPRQPGAGQQRSSRRSARRPRIRRMRRHGLDHGARDERRAHPHPARRRRRSCRRRGGRPATARLRRSRLLQRHDRGPASGRHRPVPRSGADEPANARWT